MEQACGNPTCKPFSSVILAPKFRVLADRLGVVRVGQSPSNTRLATSALENLPEGVGLCQLYFAENSCVPAAVMP